MKKVCIVTGTRAEYGLLYGLMKEVDSSPLLELQVIVTGMHLSPKFGATWQVIQNDGFKVNSMVDLGEIGDTRKSVLEQIARGINGFSKSFIELKPDIVVILGDRYEMLAVAQTAMILGIPISHIHGGEVTEGAFDDSIRHSITKMSSLHFTTTEVYKNRVIQMGENPDRVFNLGAPGLDNFLNLKLMTKKELSKNLEFDLKDKNLLVTYHPVTALEENGIDELINALKKLSNIGQIITLPNSDPGHEEIFSKWQEYANNHDNVYITKSLGQIRYLSAMKCCDLVVGNSSSGILEAPFCGTPTVNIGDRQKGRIRAESVTDCRPTGKDILNAITSSLQKHFPPSTLYGKGNTAPEIRKVLEEEKFSNIKKFYDIGDL